MNTKFIERNEKSNNKEGPNRSFDQKIVAINESNNIQAFPFKIMLLSLICCNRWKCVNSWLLTKNFKTKYHDYLQKVGEFNNILNIENLALEIQKIRHCTERIKNSKIAIINENRRIAPDELYKTSNYKINIHSNGEHRLNEEEKVPNSLMNYNQGWSAMNINENDKLI